VKRRRTSRQWTAEELVALRKQAAEAVEHLPPLDRARALQSWLHEAGTGSLECIRAEYALRRAKRLS
jgi:hypothetical protein